MKKFLVVFIEAMVTFLALLVYDNKFLNDGSYNIFVTLLFFVIFFAYYKYNVEIGKKERISIIIISVIFSLLLSVGNIFSKYIWDSPIQIFTFRRLIAIIIMTMGFLVLLLKLFSYTFVKVNKISIKLEKKKMNLSLFLCILCIIFVGNMLYFIRFYPAIMTADSFYVINYANNFILSDFHTFGHTWFFGVFFHLGKLLFNDLNMAVGLSTLVQMLCISLLFSITLKYLYEKGISKKICFLVAFIYGFTPLFGHFSVTLWRDVMFGTAFAPLFIFFYELISCDKLKKKYIVLFIISTLIILFFRNNGIYIYIFMLPFIIGIAKKERKVMTILSLSILIFYIFIKGPVFNYFGVAKSKTAEAYSIPLQQMARVVALNQNVDSKSENYLRKLWNYDKVAQQYKNVTSDPIKTLTNNNFLKENNREFFQTYLKLFVSNPLTYVEAYLMETIGYWYPDVIYWATGGENSDLFESEKEIKTTPLTPKWYNEVIDHSVSRAIPFANLFWSIGLYFMLLVLSSALTAYYNKKYLLCYVPLYGLWLSIMAATPVFCELRYVYGIFTCIPLLVIIPFIVKQSRVKERGK